MKRFAVMRKGNDQLTFNETETWFDKSRDKWVEQANDRFPATDRTARRFEKKYGVKLYWRERKQKTSGGIVAWPGYFLTESDEEVQP
jgi:hypothetical protein